MLFLEHDGAEPLELGLFLAVNQDFITAFHPAADVGNQQVEVLVENRLGSDMERSRLHIPAEGRFQMDPAERLQLGEKLLFLIHVGGIQPEGRFFWKNTDDTDFSRLAGDDIRINISRFHLFNGQLGIAVESIDPVHFVAEERDAVRMLPGIGKNVNDRTANRELAGR